jgi:methylphosphotriester-DNA--protein-cysteine methyltransferase
MDAFYLSRGFTRSIGVTPKCFLQALRREHFLRSLLSTAGRRRLTALAFDAGFDDYAAFCRFVRRELGTPPSGLLAEQTDQVLPSQPAPAAVACRA